MKRRSGKQIMREVSLQVCTGRNPDFYVDIWDQNSHTPSLLLPFPMFWWFVIEAFLRRGQRREKSVQLQPSSKAAPCPIHLLPRMKCLERVVLGIRIHLCLSSFAFHSGWAKVCLGFDLRWKRQHEEHLLYMNLFIYFLKKYISWIFQEKTLRGKTLAKYNMNAARSKKQVIADARGDGRETTGMDQVGQAEPKREGFGVFFKLLGIFEKNQSYLLNFKDFWTGKKGNDDSKEVRRQGGAAFKGGENALEELPGVWMSVRPWSTWRAAECREPRRSFSRDGGMMAGQNRRVAFHFGMVNW